MECLHTFCKSCIVKHFENDKRCPTCLQVVHETNPLEKLRADRTIQDVVYKIVDGLQQDEERRRAEFDNARGEARPNDLKRRASTESPEKAAPKQQRHKSDNEDQISFVLEQEQEKVEDVEGRAELVTDLEKPFIRTSSRATVTHLKKFLAKKLRLTSHDDVDILCRGEVLGREFTLEFIAKTRWRPRKDEQLVLKYRPRVDFDPV